VLFFATRIAASPIAGRGVFATTNIPRGTIVGSFTHRCTFLSEEDYRSAQLAGDQWVIKKAVRAIGRLFAYIGPATPAAKLALLNEDYTNHSENPSLLYHCGFLFARRDIVAGEELTVHYKYILALDDEVSSFTDAATGHRVTGLTGLEALRQSTLELVRLLPFISDNALAMHGVALTRNYPRKTVQAVARRRMHSGWKTAAAPALETSAGVARLRLKVRSE
jgi:SET domain